MELGRVRTHRARPSAFASVEGGRARARQSGLLRQGQVLAASTRTGAQESAQGAVSNRLSLPALEKH